MPGAPATTGSPREMARGSPGIERLPPSHSPLLPLVTSAGLVPTAPADLPHIPRGFDQLPLHPPVEEATELDEEDLVDLEATRPSASATRRTSVRPEEPLGFLPDLPESDPYDTELEAPDLEEEEEEPAPPTDPVPGVAPPPGPLEAPVSVGTRARSAGPISVSPPSRGGLTAVMPIAGMAGASISMHEGPVSVHSARGTDLRPVSNTPLLVDVTPLSLSVETVGGFCDSVITRNTPVPCERTRVFATAADQQVAVRVRVSQGESSRFADNTLLGELELTGLRPAPRGKVRIEVTFVLDTDGILNVHAKDVQTGRATSARLRLVGLPAMEELEELAARHAAHPTL